MHRAELNAIAVVKGTERYIFLYHDGAPDGMLNGTLPVGRRMDGS